MRTLAISLLAIVSLTGCLSLHADVPEDAVRQHIAREEGIELASICSYEGKSFSEGAVACMSERRMTCGATGRWVPDGGC
jgi:hypothetical protein